MKCCWLMPQGCPPASPLCLPHLSCHSSPCAILVLVSTPTLQSQCSKPDLGQFGLKSNPAKVCLLVCVCDCLKGSISPCDSWKGCTKVCAGRRAGRSKGKMEQAQELGTKISLTDIAAKYCIIWSHCLDQSSCIGACSLYLSKAALSLQLCLF